MNKEPPTNAEIVAGLRKSYPKVTCFEALEKKMAALNPKGGYTIRPAKADEEQIKNSQKVVKETAVKKVTCVNDDVEKNAKLVPHVPTTRTVVKLPTMRQVFTHGKLLRRNYEQWWTTYGHAAHNMPDGREYTLSEVRKWKWTNAFHEDKIEEAIAVSENKAYDAVILMMPMMKSDPRKVKKSKPIVKKTSKKAKPKANVKPVKKVIPKAITKEIVPTVNKKAITQEKRKVIVEQEDKKRKRTVKKIEDPIEDPYSDSSSDDSSESSSDDSSESSSGSSSDDSSEKSVKVKKGRTRKKAKTADVLSEADDLHKMKLWKKKFSYFAKNKDHRKGGHKKFMYHLAAYFFFRIETNRGTNYNPTPLMTTVAIQDNKKTRNKAKSFYRKSLGMDKKQVLQCMISGNARLFKRASSNPQYTTVNRRKLPIYSEYLKVKESLGIKCF